MWHGVCITTFDLLGVYYVIITLDGLYQFLRMPFGLKTEPAASESIKSHALVLVDDNSVYLDSSTES